MIRNHAKTGSLPSSESGYTILEGLMAVVVVAVLVSAIGPVVAFSVGTRVQAKRVELATQAARSYIDAVKADPVTLAPKLTSNAAPSTGDLTTNCLDGYCATDKKLYCVNFDQDPQQTSCTNSSLVDMVIQPIMTSGDPNNPQNGYQMTVRVYRANSFAAGVTLKSPDENGVLKSDSLTTNAIGDRTLPLVVMKTDVQPPGATYENIQQRVNLNSPPPAPSP